MIRERRAGLTNGTAKPRGGSSSRNDSEEEEDDDDEENVPSSTGALLDAATSYNNVGLVLRLLGKDKEALDAFGKCLTIRERHCSGNSTELAAIRRSFTPTQSSTALIRLGGE